MAYTPDITGRRAVSFSGLEGDFDGGGIKGSDSFDGGSVIGTLSFKNDWKASIRARAGNAACNWLLYVTGGAAFAGAKSTLNGTARGLPVIGKRDPDRMDGRYRCGACIIQKLDRSR